MNNKTGNKKIVFLISNMKEGGAQRVICVLSKEMVRRGYSVRIVSISGAERAYEIDDNVQFISLREWMAQNPTPILTHIKQKIERLSYRIMHHDDALIQNYNYCKKISHGLRAYLKRNPADIIYSFLGVSNIILGMAKLNKKTKTVIAERNFPDHDTEAIKKLRDKWYSRANICIFQTPEQCECLSQIKLKKTAIIPNPIKEDLPEPFNGVRRKVIVNYCGFRKQKNLSLMINTFAKIHKEYPEYELSLFGKGELQDELQRQINELGLQDNAFLFPFCPDIHQKVLDAGMFVMTSDFEGMPNSLLEAMAIGLPVISTDCLGGGAAAVIKQNINGILVPVRDEDALYHAIKELIENPEKAKIMGENATDIREILSVKRISQMWIDLIK